MGGPIDKGRKAIKKEQDKASPPVAEFEGPHQPLVSALSAICNVDHFSISGVRRALSQLPQSRI